MRVIINLIEAFSRETTGLAAWYNPSTGMSFVADNSHANIMFDHPGDFGYSSDELDTIYDEDSNHLDIVYAGLANGWVRINLYFGWARRITQHRPFGPPLMEEMMAA